MLRKRRTIAALIALVLSVLTLASCGGGASDSTSGASLKLTVWNTQGTDSVWYDLEEDIPSKWLTEKTGVAVQNIYGNDGGQWDSKLTKLVAGDNLPHIVWCQSSQGPAHFNKLLELGKLQLLTDEMLQEYAPDIWKRTPSYVWDQFRTEDGKITGIPWGFKWDDIDTVYYDYTEEERKALRAAKESQTSSVQNSLYIRDDILKQIYPECMSYDEIMALMEEKQGPVGDEIMDIPINSTEEFIDFMYKIKDLNLTENGKKVYAFGYAGDGNDNWEALVYLGNLMYGSNWHQYTTHWNTATEKVELPLMGDLVKQMAKTQNDLINDGVIDPESLAHTNAQFQAKVFQGQYAICSAIRAGGLDTINKQIEENGGTFNYRPFWLSLPAPEGYEPFKVVSAFGSSMCMLNTLSEEEVIKVLEWANLQFTDEYMEIAVWGTPEDDLYTEDADGKRTYKDDRFNQTFIYGVGDALETVQTKGLGLNGNKLRLYPMSVSRYTPDYMNDYVKLTPTSSTGFRFSVDSVYLTSVQSVPPCYAYSSEVANVPDLIEFWARREEWEIAIKKAIASAPGEFDSKWEAMKDIVNDVCDYKQMEADMTEIALTYYDDIKAAEAQ